MNRIISSALLLTLSLSAHATDFSGLITGNTTWTKANSPYHIVGHTLIDSNATLTIEPGVEILLGHTYNFYIEGNIKAIGTKADSIRITYPQFIFRRTAQIKSAEFSYCSFYKGLQYAIFGAENTDMVVTNSTFSICQVAIFTAGKTFISKNKFSLSHVGVGNAGNWITGEISENEFAYNSSAISYVNNCTIRNNYFHHNELCFAGDTTQVVELSGNTFAFNKTGLSFNTVNFINGMHHNVMVNNNAGFYLKGLIGPISHNTIRHNTWVGVLSGNGGVYDIIYNCLDSNANNIMVNGNLPVYIKENYWGTTDSALIEAKMQDYDKDFNTAQIYYMPVLSQADTGCRPTPAQNEPTYITSTTHTKANLRVYPNPASEYLTLSANKPIQQITLHTIDGRLLHSELMPGEKSDIQISLLSPGLYIYNVLFEDGERQTGKILKQ